MAKKINRAFERVDREMCWICEERKADSQEHSFKSSRLKALWKEGGEQPLRTIGADGKGYEIRGPKSGNAMFGVTMCSYCNNEFSQPFDKAYDHFIGFILEDLDYFRERRYFTWDEVFDGTDFDQRHLARYYVKNMGCRMIDKGAEEVPFEIRQYLFDLDMVQPFTLLLYKDYETVQMLDPARPQEWLQMWAQSGGEFDGDELEGFVGALQDGFIGAMFEWCAPHRRGDQTLCFGFEPGAYVRDRRELPHQELWDDFVSVSEITIMNRLGERFLAAFESLMNEAEQLKKAGKIVQLTAQPGSLAVRNHEQLVAQWQERRAFVERMKDELQFRQEGFARKTGLDLDWVRNNT